jgi:hypothetical protein
LRVRSNPATRRFQAPSEPTIRGVLQGVDAARVDASLSDWLLGRAASDEALAVDVKSARRAVREDGSRVHVLSACSLARPIEALSASAQTLRKFDCQNPAARL